MTPSLSRTAFYLLVAGSAAWVWLTAASLPPVVASHFGAAGQANGHLPRSTYAAVMTALVLVVPFVTSVVPSLLMSASGTTLNIPNRDVWLSDEHRDATIAFLRMHLQASGMVMALFLAYVHGLVLRANRLDPPVLPTGALVAGLAVLGVLAVLWVVVLCRRFGDRARLQAR